MAYDVEDPGPHVPSCPWADPNHEPPVEGYDPGCRLCAGSGIAGEGAACRCDEIARLREVAAAARPFARTECCYRDGKLGVDPCDGCRLRAALDALPPNE